MDVVGSEGASGSWVSGLIYGVKRTLDRGGGLIDKRWCDDEESSSRADLLAVLATLVGIGWSCAWAGQAVAGGMRSR